MSPLKNGGVYRFGCVSRDVKAAFSGKPYTLKQRPEFIEAAGFSGADLALVHQVHGARVLCVDSQNIPETTVEADGLLTHSPRLILAIKTADCLPVLFEDPVRRVVGAVHAGWRGLKAGILEKTVLEMTKSYGSTPEDIQVYIGPAIRGCCYEVGSEFQSFFPAFYKPGRKSGGPEAGGMFDPVQAAKQRLQNEGIEALKLVDSGYCTVCQNDLFHSFRAEKTQERILSVIALGMS